MPYKNIFFRGMSIALIFALLGAISPLSYAKKVRTLKPVTFTETTLIATAYYSPLPGQSYYLRGNYESEKRLNGNGTHGASGKAVFEGMIAAPKNYAFGTKVYIEGLGVGSVEDRGGAIVPAGSRGYEHDRVDIWMGKGEEGLARALAWGKRKVTARVYHDATTSVAFDVGGVQKAKLSNSVAKVAVSSSTAKASLAQTPKVKEVSDLDAKMAFFEKEKARTEKMLQVIGTPTLGETGRHVRYLQELLASLGYFHGKTSAIYGKRTKEAVAAFQKDM